MPALFIFQLGKDGALSHKETVGLRGNVLDVTLLGGAGGRALLVAIDSINADADADVGGGGEILIFKRDGESWVSRGSIQSTAETEEQPILSREELDRALYTVENLRKSEIDEEGDEEAAAAAAVAPETPEQGSESKSYTTYSG